MYNLMKDHHKKFTELNKLVPRTEHNINKKKKVLINAENLYNKLHYIYKNKYNKKINNLDIKNRKKLDYKKLRLTDNYQYPSEEEQKEMETIFMNTENSKTNEPHRFRLDLTDKLNLKNP